MAPMEPDRATFWQEAWDRAGLARARRVPGRGKFYALVAYPGTSGFLHVGHLRGYAYADPLHRYHRMRGVQVFFPFGVHASGLPAVAWARKVESGDPGTIAQLDDHGVSPAERKRLEQPEYAARFLGREYLRVLRRLGVLVDPDSYVTTIDDDYRAFVRWQITTLAREGEVVQGAYFASVCPVCGPVAVDAAETDLSQGGDAEVVAYTTVPFRLDDGRTLLAATLRPETVFGVTNLWLPPAGELVVWHRGSDEFLVARAGGERLVEQHGGRLGHPVPVAGLLGRGVRVPFRDVVVPVLPSALVDPRVGTGVVMSVPAHAPADAAAVAELPPDDRARIGTPPVLLDLDRTGGLAASEAALEAGEGTPAERALRAVGAAGGSGPAPIDEATERLYRLEFSRGVMRVAGLDGVPVREARVTVAARLLERGGSFELREFSKPVVCRNGHEVVIRRIPDQWFLRYSDPAWKARTRAVTARVTTVPADYARDLPGIIDWFGDRPCARKGPWLGTPFPLDPAWIVEPIADSTFYMAYFVVRRFVADGRLRTEQLTDPFFDAVFLGRGPGEPTVDPGLAATVREEFLYWYPLDVNIAAKEHKRVHFPVFLYTHAKLLPDELQPRGVFEHGWITNEQGGKLSKKDVAAKGGHSTGRRQRIPAIDDALGQWGPDPLRLAQVVAAAPAQDLEWSEEAVEAAAERLREMERLIAGCPGDGAGPPELDAWLTSRLHDLVARYHAAFAAWEFRDAAEIAFAELPALLRRYLARGGAAGGSATDTLGRVAVRLIAPFTPHVAEELNGGWFEGLVAEARMPEADEFARSPVAEAREAFLDRVEDDLRAVLRPTREKSEPAPDAVVFFVAPPWKAEVERWIRDALDRGETPTIRALMERAQGHPDVLAHRAQLPRYVERVAKLLRGESREVGPAVDEAAVLATAEGYLARRFGFRVVRVVPEEAAAEDDPTGRRDRARPGRPAFYLTRPGEPRSDA